MKFVAIICFVLSVAACSKEEVRADQRDQRWAIQTANRCPAVAALVRRSLQDGELTIAEVENVSGAVRAVMQAPVRGQTCDVRYGTPPSTRDRTVNDGMTVVGKTPTMKMRTIESVE